MNHGSMNSRHPLSSHRAMVIDQKAKKSVASSGGDSRPGEMPGLGAGPGDGHCDREQRDHGPTMSSQQENGED